MPKRKSQKNNNQSSPEIVTPQKPAILRIVKQNTTETSANSPALPELSAAVAREKQPIEPDLPVNNNQNPSTEVSEEHSSSHLADDAVPQTIIVDNEQSDFSLTVETVPVNVEESTATKPSTSDTLASPEPEKKLTQSGKEFSYKKLETATNSQGQTFTVDEKIEVITFNFGTQQAVITLLYSAPDGSIWATYYPLTEEQKQQWRRGCCRIEYLKKLFSNVSNS
ncbi:hypothetical protein VF14_23945 [Nostoc linckia z18]|uniref:Uncharacterized protein n=2 Tax=Nostoc linckia TaxID=92942 RepID=A0A9Q6EJK7_NOSLI|nr:hypothetical protein [Nostoc linckia]PHK39971.1 hypothetical protein VF12_12215 [Nostoc linckia z15]PHK43991.1 hypothetical protein VF13_24060 [Nostoc linckia z16]PHJ56878.1 hypothetical protein VF02_31850 [Nostoc linckia z1]PHJ58768.1 hypothetical protein VF05_33440 [Nostoc linckia z3]PHJ62545.1 hypothetical protein VF03_31150 [Nostoc linckia z2]